MLINGRQTGLQDHDQYSASRFTVMPLPVFKLIGDLAVDTGTWFGTYRLGRKPGFTPIRNSISMPGSADGE